MFQWPPNNWAIHELYVVNSTYLYSSGLHSGMEVYLFLANSIGSALWYFEQDEIKWVEQCIFKLLCQHGLKR